MTMNSDEIDELDAGLSHDAGILESHGYDIESVESARRALRQLKADNQRLVAENEALKVGQGDFKAIDRPKRKDGWMGLRVRTTEACRNRMIEVPEGSTGTVEDVPHGRIDVAFDPCPCCGHKALIAFTAPYDAIEPIIAAALERQNEAKEGTSAQLQQEQERDDE